jgi:hypothetical protein
MPAPNLTKANLQVSELVFLMETTPSRKTIHRIVLLGRVIPNTVVKTYFSENTWRATAWEDNPMPAPNLTKSQFAG